MRCCLNSCCIDILRMNYLLFLLSGAVAAITHGMLWTVRCAVPCLLDRLEVHQSIEQLSANRCNPIGNAKRVTVGAVRE